MIYDFKKTFPPAKKRKKYIYKTLLDIFYEFPVKY